MAAAIVSRAHTFSLASVALIPVDEQTDAESIAEKIHAITLPMGVSTTSLPNISSLSAQNLVSSVSGMIALATKGVSLIDEVTATWSVLENARKPIVGVILADIAH